MEGGSVAGSAPGARARELLAYTLVVRRPKEDVGAWMEDVGAWMEDVGAWMERTT